MTVEQIYTGCLSQGAYYITSGGEAAIIDPLRETKPYLERLERDEVKLKYIFETHFHADFVSGHVTLAAQTEASIIYGPNADPVFDALIASDNQEFRVGDITIIALHTPGHTMESTTYLLRDENGKDHCIFSGDTLFLGDVGRPDLAQKGDEITQEDLAGILYESLQTKIIPLADDVIVYPAHGAGSSCGKHMMKETVDTLGNQKKVNYALREGMTKEEFIKEVTDGLLPPPRYFPLNVKMNKEGYDHLDTILDRGTRELSPEMFEQLANETSAVILDVRHQIDFMNAHIPNSIFIGIDGSFAPWVGAMIADVQQPILIICPPGREEETVTRLSRVGFDNTLGYLKGGLQAWKESERATDTMESISAEVLKGLMQKDVPVFDVRKEIEFGSTHIPEAKHASLEFINRHLDEFPTDEPFYVYCAGGYRSVIAASILKNRGIHNVVDVAGGFKAIKEAGISVSAE